MLQFAPFFVGAKILTGSFGLKFVGGTLLTKVATANTLGGLQTSMMRTTVMRMPKGPTFPKPPSRIPDYDKIAKVIVEGANVYGNVYLENKKEETRQLEIEYKYKVEIEKMLVEKDIIIAKLAYKTEERKTYIEGLFSLLKDAYHEGRVEDAEKFFSKINSLMNEQN